MKKIRFYPFNDGTRKFAPEPEPTSKFLPDWYKKTPSVINNGSIAFGELGLTVKKCMPIFDLMTAGYTITLPCDVYVDATNPEKLHWSIPNGILPYQGDMFAVHAKDQYSNMPVNKAIYHEDLLRIFPFWAVGTPKGYSAIFLNPPYSENSPLVALQAIVDTDTFITDGHLSFWVEKNFKGIIKQGTPLVQVIPFKRDDWKKEVAGLEEAESRFETQRLRLRSAFSNSYKNIFRSKKTYS
jgi:hypothetical protein